MHGVGKWAQIKATGKLDTRSSVDVKVNFPRLFIIYLIYLILQDKVRNLQKALITGKKTE